MTDSPLDAASPRRNPVLTLLQPKVSVPVIVLLLLIAGPFLFRASRVSGLPDAGDPFDVATFVNSTVPAGENAFDDYVSAHGILVPLPSDENDNLEKALTDGWGAASDGVRAWLDANSYSLAHWKQGTLKRNALYVSPANAQIDTQIPVTQDLRSFARLARLSGLRHESEGKLDEALSDYRAIFRCSRHSGRNGFLVERLVGAALHGIASEAIEKWSRDPRLKAEPIEAALRDVQDDYRLTAPASENLKVEYILLSNTLDRDDSLEALDLGGSPSPAVSRAAMFFLNEPELSRLVVQQVFANKLEQVDKPRWQRPPRYAGSKLGLYDDPSVKLPENRLPAQQIVKYYDRTMLARMCLPGLEGVDNAICREQARQATLTVALAAQIHRLRHGAFPRRVEELVERNILSEIPFDPYSTRREPLRYRNDHTGQTIWSVGENQTDDGGSLDATGRFNGPDDGLLIPGVGEHNSP